MTNRLTDKQCIDFLKNFYATFFVNVLYCFWVVISMTKDTKVVKSSPTKNEIENFRNAVIKEILGFGGGEGDARFVRDEVVLNGIKLGRDPKDVAWALLQ